MLKLFHAAREVHNRYWLEAFQLVEPSAEAISCSQRGTRQILAEAFQLVEPSAEAISCSQRGTWFTHYSS
jgi:hypothetical protein